MSGPCIRVGGKMFEVENKRFLPSCTKQLDTLDPNELEDLVDRAKDWAVMHGMGVRPTKYTTHAIEFAPFALLPSTLPRKEFQNVCDIQRTLNELMHWVAHDYNFLKETLKETIKVDEFTGKLFDIYETVYKEGIVQKVSLGLMRSDYMLDSACQDRMECLAKPFGCLKQVEINTIAAGMAWLGPITAKCHQFILSELGQTHLIKNLLQNDALEGTCTGIVQAWRMYNNPNAAILFIVEDISFNICDQRYHEFEIKRQNPSIKVIRKTLTQLSKEASLSRKKELIVNNRIIGVVYFRAGYSPIFYPTESEWAVRLLIERSLAIKSPSIQYHLAGTKKVQQALAMPGILGQYLKDEKMVARVKDIFTGLYSLGADENGNTTLAMALANPERFVLKPQREGGGNNIYGSDIKVYLESMKSPQDREGWILMDRINPPAQFNYIIRAGDDLEIKRVTSELGIFGAVIGDEERIYFNKQVGHLLRTKLESSNEGGLMSGTAAADSPFLID